MISKSIFWAVSLALFTIAATIAWVAGKRGNENAALRSELQNASAKVDREKSLCAVEKGQAEGRATTAESRAKEGEAREKKLRQDLAAWKTNAVRAGIVPWLQSHANCSGRGADGHCSAYRLPDGTVLETDLPERIQ